MRSIRNNTLFYILICGAVLAGCESTEIVGLPTANTPEYWNLTEQNLAAVTNLSERGRVGLINAEDRVSASYSFKMAGEEISLELISPIGSQIGLLEISPYQSTLLYNNEIYADDDAQVLLRQVLSLDLPVNDLTGILLGIPQGEISRDENGRIVNALCRGYLISYGGFREYNGLALPTDLTIAAGSTEIRLRVNEVNELN